MQKSIIGSLILVAPIASAQVELSEVYPNPPGSDAQGEYIEIYNAGQEEVDLEGYELDDYVDKGSPKYKLNGKIGGGEYVIIPYSSSKITLNNSNEEVRLIKDGQDIEVIQYKSSTEGKSYTKVGSEWEWKEPSPGEGETIGEVKDMVPDEVHQQENTEDQISSVDRNEITSGGSGADLLRVVKEIKMQEEVKPEYPDDIRIHRIMTNPAGNERKNEWIEIKNTGTKNRDVGIWRIDDKENEGASPFLLEGVLAANEVVRLHRSKTKIALSNEGGILRLISPDGQEKDAIKYGKSSEGKILSRENNWKDTSRATEKEKKESRRDDGKSNNKLTNKKSLCKIKNNKIHFNEILNDHYIEIVNLHDKPIDLSGCKFSDGYVEHEIYSGIIKPGKLKIWTQDVLEIDMSHSNYFLLDSDGKLVTRVLVPDSQKLLGMSWARDWRGVMRWTSMPTPGRENKIYANKPPRISDNIEVITGREFNIHHHIVDNDSSKVTCEYNPGDGGDIKNENQSHVYKLPGEYLLTVKMFDGINRVTQSVRLTAKDPPENNEIEMVEIRNIEGLSIGLHNRAKHEVDIGGYVVNVEGNQLWQAPRQLILHPEKVTHIYISDKKIKGGKSIAVFDDMQRQVENLALTEKQDVYKKEKGQWQIAKQGVEVEKEEVMQVQEGEEPKKQKENIDPVKEKRADMSLWMLLLSAGLPLALWGIYVVIEKTMPDIEAKKVEG